MKRLLSIALTMFCSYCMMAQQDTSTVVGRLQYVYALKNAINDRVWQGFADKKNNVQVLFESAVDTLQK